MGHPCWPVTQAFCHLTLNSNTLFGLALIVKSCLFVAITDPFLPTNLTLSIIEHWPLSIGCSRLPAGCWMLKYLSPVLVSFSASSGLLTVLKLPRVPGQIESWATESKSKFHQGATRPARDQSKIPSHRSQPFRPVISDTGA